MNKCKYYDDGYCTSDNLDCGFCQLCCYRDEEDNMEECAEYEEWEEAQQ